MLRNDLLRNYVANLDIFVADYFVCLKMRSHFSAVLIRNFIISPVVALQLLRKFIWTLSLQICKIWFSACLWNNSRCVLAGVA